MAATEESGVGIPEFVLSADVVGWAIEELQGRRIHPFFAAYLLVRQQAGRQNLDRVEPKWDQLDVYLGVPGGPPGKPWFRPFRNNPKRSAMDWMNNHPAGSWSPRSVRTGTPGRRVLDVDGRQWVLTEGHWERAREHLLHGEQMPLIALSAFLYRDYGFRTGGISPYPLGLVEIFRNDFAYRPASDDDEFDHLYDLGFPPDRDDWFVRPPEGSTG